MSNSAIASGDVDHVVLPSDMSATILQYANITWVNENAIQKKEW
ncbi:MAG: hypothetical protein EOO10_19245 [Chitinophagaceae bacterium]|nr:MAG: hypothetical protein EOO10_19245 [Chitinophagaceae bacterium]